MTRLPTPIFALTAAFLVFAEAASAQTAAFTYQGRLTDSSTPATGPYDMEFRLFDLPVVGTQQGATLSLPNVQVANGMFTVPLNFGSAVFAIGANRFLEVSLRPAGSSGAYTPLFPRQQLTSTPYSVRSLNAGSLGGITANQYVLTNDARLSDARDPLPDSPSYIRNTTTSQTADFSISGNGTVSGLTVNGHTDLGDSPLDTISTLGRFNTNLSPIGNGIFDFGTASSGWRDAYLNGAIRFGTGPARTLFTFTTPTSAQTISLPDATGTVITTGNLTSITATGTLGSLAAGSAAITSGLTVDGTTLVVDAVNNRVGIGTAAPTRILAMNGESGQTFGVERRTASDVNGSQLIIGAGGASAGGNNRQGGNLVLHSGVSTGAAVAGSSILFQTPTPGAFGTVDNPLTTRVTIGSAGDVGIGSSPLGSPARLLVIRAGEENSTNYGLMVSNATTGTIFGPQDEKVGARITNSGSVSFANAGAWIENLSTSNTLPTDAETEKYGLKIDSTGSFGGSHTQNWGLHVDVGGAGNNYAAAFHGGSVGIGTSVPVDRLQVMGNIRVGTSGTNGCIKDFSGNPIAGTCSSDRRLKKSITSFPSVLDRIIRLRPVNFYWRTEEFKEKAFGSAQSSGLVAQEVDEVMPDLVTEDAEGFKAVNYSKLPLLTLQAVKELKEENDRLRKEVLVQEERDKVLQKQIDALKQLVCAQNPRAEVCKEEK